MVEGVILGRQNKIHRITADLFPGGMVWIPGGEFSMGGVNPAGMAFVVLWTSRNKKTSSGEIKTADHVNGQARNNYLS